MTTTPSLHDFLREHSMAAAPELVVEEEDGTLRCLACGNRCRIPEGDAGTCRMRENVAGQLRVPAGYVAGMQVDPLEKKPFFHAYPGRDALSFGMLGCNLRCDFCQNWVTSQTLRDDLATALPNSCGADDIVRAAVAHAAPVIVSTYNEPLITSDWAMKVFQRAREKGIVCGYVSNGNASDEVIAYLRPVMDLFKIDLKSFDEAGYRGLGGQLKNVLRTIERTKELGFWTEVVTLIVPGFNDSERELAGMARFIAGVSRDIPWHVTAFHPDYRAADKPYTRPEQLRRAHELGKEAGLDFVYAGNLSGLGDLENTNCPGCGTLLIERRGFRILQNRMDGTKCPACAMEIPGIWEAQPPRRGKDSGFPRRVTV